MGKKETPPSRGMALLWTLRESGMSKSFLRIEMSRMRGISMRAMNTDMTKASIRYSMNNGTWGLKVNGSLFEYFKRILVILDILQLFNDLPLCGGKGASLPAPYD